MNPIPLYEASYTTPVAWMCSECKRIEKEEDHVRKCCTCNLCGKKSKYWRCPQCVKENAIKQVHEVAKIIENTDAETLSSGSALPMLNMDYFLARVKEGSKL